MPTRTTRTILLAVSLFTSLPSINAQGLTISPGANLVISGSPNLVISNGGFNNAGTFLPGTGTVIFTGTANSTTTAIGGTAAISFYNLSFNKSAGSASLSRNIAVTNVVDMFSGNLDLNGFDLDLGSLGNIANESVNARITGLTGGLVVRTATLNAPNDESPGNIGIAITSPANLGLTTIRRGHLQPVSTGGYGINRFYDIEPANNTALNATLRFFYADAELAGINEAELMFWSSPTGAQPWTLLGADARDATFNYVEKTGINEMNTFALASSVINTLPVQLLYFDGLLADDKVQLQWATAAEHNSAHFDVERSADGRQFKAIAKVSARGNANSETNYSFTDAAVFDGVFYYRLKQVDADGNFTLSNVIAVSKKALNQLLSVFPNPANGPFHIRFISSKVMNADMQLMDNMGNILLNRSFLAKKGLNEWTSDLGTLPAGTYYLRLNGIDSKVWQIIKR